MSFGPAQWVLAHLGAWTWFVAENRVWLIVAITVIGFVAPLLGAFRKYRPRPTPSVVLRSAATALGFSSVLVTVCSLMHFSDLRWLAPGQRAHPHLSAPGGLFSFAKPIVGAVNTVTGVPVEFRAVEASVHVALSCALIALAALLVAALTSRRARRADIRQIVREEMGRSASVHATESHSGSVSTLVVAIVMTSMLTSGRLSGCDAACGRRQALVGV